MRPGNVQENYMKNPRQYHRAAVASGRWSLYRNNPKRLQRGLNPFRLDSMKPSLPIHRYFEMEKRYAQVAYGNPNTYDKIQDSIERCYLNHLDRAKDKPKLTDGPLN